MGRESGICPLPQHILKKDNNWKIKVNIQNINSKQFFNVVYHEFSTVIRKKGLKELEHELTSKCSSFSCSEES
jgi:hypothetical protein